ncbi:MAG: type II toxin-antitoxin system ParD family antitoxin [Azospirillaceae bacterium]|nr:type II toxin-antitoxin system ParD family antitoxin [Azospirillaceae bacterium]
MPSSYTLGRHFEEFIQSQLHGGRYNNASEVVRDALRLLEARERRLAALDAVLDNAIAAADAGHVVDAQIVFDELDAELASLPDTSF